MHPFNAIELYAIARATAGLSWTDLPLSPALKLILDNLQTKDVTSLLRLLGPEVTAQILSLDPHAPPPAPPAPMRLSDPSPGMPSFAPISVPALPAEAHLSDGALAAAEKVGGWLDETLVWAAQRSPMTPRPFLTAGLVWAAGLAIARRCAVPLHKLIYPHLYILWVAPTSIFKKTTGMEAIFDLVNTAMPHMLLPEESTPEAFIGALGGKAPPNYDRLPAIKQQLEDQGRRFAAQRGLLIDEASSLFGAARKDYMQGHAEMIMRLYDAPQRYARNIRSEGKIVIYDASLCILGATTPASLSRNITAQSWETGELARFILLYPEQDMAYDLGNSLKAYKPPADLVHRLETLHQHLPEPPNLVSHESDAAQSASFETISARMDKDAFAAYDRYTKAVTYDLLRGTQQPDARLHPNYARLHVQAIKVALTLATLDWSDQGGKDSPCITLGHWARAQQIAESWRTSAHRLIDVLNRGEDSLTEARTLELLLATPAGLTLRDLTRQTGLRRKAIDEALKALEEAGLISSTRQRRGERGPEATIYVAHSEKPGSAI